MKRLMALFRSVLEESGAFCGVSTINDYKTVVDRVENEGLSFLTITLPTFSAELEKALKNEKVGSASFPGFAKRGCLPEFLSGFTRLIFDLRTGQLLLVPNIQAIRCVRQITLLFKRIELECTKERTAQAYAKYMQCEKDIRQHDTSYIGSALQTDFRKAARMMFMDLFCNIENNLYAQNMTPKHSKGSTADRLIGNDKYRQLEWPMRLQNVVPWDSALLPSPRWSAEDYPVILLEPGQERPVRVIPVPKTLKTPRLIAMEPTCMQYVQQGILRLFDEQGPLCHTYWSLCQNVHQEPNQRSAKQGSSKNDLATLDLSEASDRVSYQHVRDLLYDHPLLTEFVDACRSRKADVPGYGVIRLAKFASMGSSLCFPFEAMVFATICLMGCAAARAVSLDPHFIKKMRGKVRVYGDDIIVPVDCAITVKSFLESFGYQVNSSKSFWTGKFRESCGKEYYDGVDVSIVRVRREFPQYRMDVDELVSTVELHNHFYEAGWFSTAEHIKQAIKNCKVPEIPYGVSSVIGFWDYSPSLKVKWHPTLHKPLIKALQKDSYQPPNGVDGVLALMKFFVERGLVDPLPQRAYERSGRARNARIKTGWYEAR